jgi:hypothetical protein
MAIHIDTESPRDDFEILHSPITRILPHTSEDLLGIRHSLLMVPNMAPRSNASARGDLEVALPETDPLADFWMRVGFR